MCRLSNHLSEAETIQHIFNLKSGVQKMGGTKIINIEISCKYKTKNPTIFNVEVQSKYKAVWRTIQSGNAKLMVTKIKRHW